MVWTISTLSAELEKLLTRISNDLVNTLVNLDGSLKDIGSGTHIKIPMDVGFVNYYRLPKSCEITIYLKERLVEKETEALDLYNTKSDEL